MSRTWSRHGMAIPAPRGGLQMDWRPPPHGGASHRWQIGARSWEVIPRVRVPHPGLPVFVCGEAFSDDQGWVEGALRTAERVVQSGFGVPPPDWLPPDTYLGP